MAPRPVPEERVRALLDLLAAGVNPLRASRAAGVSQPAQRAHGHHPPLK